jgi:hypothetical protein
MPSKAIACPAGIENKQKHVTNTPPGGVPRRADFLRYRYLRDFRIFVTQGSPPLNPKKNSI